MAWVVMYFKTASTIQNLKSTISFKLLKVVFSIYFIVTIALTSLHMYVEFENAKTAVTNELTRLGKIFTPSLTEALWSLETDLIHSTVKGILQSPVIVGVMIHQKEGHEPDIKAGVIKGENGDPTIVDTLQTNARSIKNSLHYNLIEYSFPVLRGERLIGHVTFYSNTGIVLEEVKVGFLFIVVNAVLKTIALWLLFLWAGSKFLSQPLGALAKAVDSTRIDKLEKINVVGHIKDKNELHKLEASFNSMIGNLQDAVQAKVTTQIALGQSEQYLQDVFNSMPSVLIGVDRNNCVSHWNRKAENLTNITADEALGKPIDTVLQQFNKYLAICKESIDAKETRNIERIPITINNNKRYFSIVVYPLILSQAGVVMRLDDVTQRVQMETVMVQTEKMTSLGTLAAGMAHEINNPLGAILQGVQNITRRFDPTLPKNLEVAKECNITLDGIQQYMDKRGILMFLKGIQEVGERAANIVKNVLKFSRKSDAKMESAHIHTIIDETIAIISTDYEIKKQTAFKAIEFLKHFDPKVGSIMCSPSELEQVLLNLLKNAAHAVSGHMQPDGHKIEVSTFFEGDSIRLEIKDNGPGIEPETRKRIFEPFFTTKPVGIGTGLGLSISYGIIVDKHHGSLTVESEPGKGATFIIRLPIVQPDTVATDVSQTPTQEKV